ncbi:hypothetical protein [Paracidovorax citrulli]|uniref:hypothetical protein n=1 Tax=Paracidovorax citrulli TaxID=80869 RepID=UPI003FA74002
MSSTSYIDRVLEQRGLQAAFDEACGTVRRQADEVDSWWNSRFFERRVLDGGAKKLWPTTEARISRAYDLQDCEPEVPEFLFCDEDGELYPLTIGPQSRINTEEESPFVYAASAIVANGKVVGHVMYTDH